MGSGSSHVRTKVAALLVSLAALWAFAAYVTLRDGLDLLWVDTMTQKVSRPTDDLITALQQERRLSLVYLSGHAPGQREALDAQRVRTDGARTRFEELARGRDVRLVAGDQVTSRVDDAFARLKGLDDGRAAIDAGIVSRADAAATFTDVIDAGFGIYGSLSTLDDTQLASDNRVVTQLSRAREVLSEEDALLAGMLAAGRFTDLEHAQFTQLVGAQRFLYAETAVALTAPDAAQYQAVSSGAALADLRTLEDRVVAKTAPPLPVSAEVWEAAVDAAAAELHGLERAVELGTVARAKPRATWVVVRLVLAGGLGLIAVVASVVVSVTTARSLVRRLDRLRRAAWDLANVRLPGVVERIRRGDEVDVAVEAPPLAAGSDEIGQVGRAFNAVQQTAVQVAVEQAELRRGVRDVFLSLARRTQALVHRQLGVLDAMERREVGPDELADLFRVDHLATRMRRNAENPIVLSGAGAGRSWRNPVPMVDGVRAAGAEVEDYARVTVPPVGRRAVAGRAVGDVIHLLAELVENATTFSPPDTTVLVGGQLVANGFAVEIEDRGLGMSDE